MCLLNETHTEYLRARGITSKHITERRGYASQSDGLLIPWYSLPDGLPRGYEIRLDEIVDGKKFARPKGQPTTLNIHPDMLDLVRDQTKPLFVVEGTTRCDALAEINVPAVSIPGCYNFMSEKSQLPDWDSVPMMGRNVIIGLDGDVVTNPNVNAAMFRLAELCARKGAKHIRVLVLPNGLGLDDWLAAGNSVFDMNPYLKRHDEITQLKPKRQLPENRARKIVGGINDVKLAEDFVNSNLNNARFDSITDNWVVFDKTRWTVSKSDALVRGMVTEMMIDKASALSEDPEAQDILLSSAKISSVTLAVKSHPRIAARLDEFDKDGWIINLENGTFDLRTGVLHPHDASILVTQQARCNYDPTAQAPNFMKFIEWALPNPNVRKFVQKLLGQALVGEVNDHVLPIFTGTGGNGKGTLLGVIRDILGDYAFEAKDDLLIDVKNPSHDEKDALLEHRRFVTCEEPQKGRLHMERVKKLSGGNQITAAFKGKTARTFEPSHTLCVATNTLPDFDGEDSPAVRRRLRIVEFGQTATEVDIHLPEKLRAEADGIFLWLLEGLSMWRNEGLGAPDEVMAASVNALVEADTLAQFLRDTVTATGSPTDEVIAQELYKLYAEWMQKETFGKGTISNRKFTQEVKKRIRVVGDRSTSGRDGRKTYLQGLKLQSEVTESNFSDVDNKPSVDITVDNTKHGLTSDGYIGHIKTEVAPQQPENDPDQLSLFGQTDLESDVYMSTSAQKGASTCENTVDNNTATSTGPNASSPYPWIMWTSDDPATRSALVTDCDDHTVTSVGIMARSGLDVTYATELDKRAPKRLGL